MTTKDIRNFGIIFTIYYFLPRGTFSLRVSLDPKTNQTNIQILEVSNT
jgi:hypothetical protein